MSRPQGKAEAMKAENWEDEESRYIEDAEEMRTAIKDASREAAILWALERGSGTEW